MTDKSQKSEPRKRNWVPILIAGAGLAVLCVIAICVLLILLVLPAFDIEVPNPFAARPESTQEGLAPGEAPSEEPEIPLESPMDESYQRALEMAGEWEGTWVNNTFSSSGAASLRIEVDPSGLATLTLDLDGFVFGMFDPDPVVYTANFGGGRIDFDVTNDPVFGDFLATGLSDGTVSIEAELIPIEGIASLTADGTFTPQQIRLAYTVEFFGGGDASGVVILNKTP
jgi:hypothetical protein